eukprot:scaffold75867_cov35-Prasinocladus_malaysianus.AAC.1
MRDARLWLLSRPGNPCSRPVVWESREAIAGQLEPAAGEGLLPSLPGQMGHRVVLHRPSGHITTDLQ